MKKRIPYAFAALLLFLTEAVIALMVYDDFIRPYMGDALVVILLYCMVRTVVPEKMILLPLYVFLFACFTEFMQYLHIVERLGLQDHTFFRILIGMVFDWSDILSYGVGCMLLGVYEAVKSRYFRKGGNGRGDRV
ncbi:MAG: DUF2809 domain-containing protein [Lachnospiraceae bacterium]|nr:DUF2809 domain-containing protein [Lachnospiraceae bacterium]